ncbi:oligosaccharide flippase family protein [Eubacterium ventriosum]|uniref:oligosaccharide flippase family protein n=1 Tax=Eubacterium ventriosum TaxID=39496 RepID=UPI0035222218
MLNKNPIIKGTIILTIASLLSRIIGFLYRIFLSNLIGAKGMGVFQLIFPVLVFCIALSCGGVQIAVSRFVAESKSRKECFLVLISSIIMSLSLSFITLGVLYFFAEPVSLFIIKNKSCTELLKYASFTIPLATFHACITGYYLGFKKTFVPAWSGVVEQIAKVISLFILWLVWVEKGISITPVIAVYSMVISELCGVIFCLIAIFGERFFAFKISEIFSVMKKMFSVSYVLTLNKIMLTFLQTLEAVIFPTVLLKSGLSLSDSLSIYGILTGMALPVVTFPSAINTSVSTMLLPTIAGANSGNDVSGIKKTTEYSIWFSMITGIFCVGVFLFYGDFIGTNIFRQPLAGEYIMILAWLCPFLYLSITLGSILHGLGLTNSAFIHNVIGVVIRLASLWFGVPVFGVEGYLIGLLISNLVVTLLHSFYIHKYVDFNFSAIDNIVKPALWIAIGLIMGKLVSYIFSFADCKGLVFCIFSAGISGVIIVMVFGYFVWRESVNLKQYKNGV